ncbi:helix-turn-helix domain-containing protein [Bacteroides helcogenes]|uniref:Helix-turn-helix domain protein n=1 Tax=Bacteroides helcogenes (strain ATCC 35417 / DSM 20613 / JCM 6297 / CCUG 15421 / P 36-108) TaxID=693979 RepID=E6SWE4_BACT6|nr:helix-turn-helix transcriptional regulator [Bacteroides helcogenes]ADV44605.1 helix-turn-helix domain protein [Bacteroides helcogenes P 36-108]MDY5238895.1 helix-turn-helix transcriptional regulator [Bacteroides helcogenes]
MLFQDKLRELRESHNLLQRQVAAGIDMDTAVYCKIEKGDRQARDEQVRQLALFYGIPYEELRRYWMAGRIYSLVEDEEDANVILYMVAEEMEEYNKYKGKNYNQD